ncbi:MAG: asparagine synthase B [Anaerolineales bacterium]|nr:asparagine synthase B [Anaerolineales bacterium]
MCGIAGVWGGDELRTVRRMNQRQAHRGPDGHATHSESGQCTLGHTRLAIIDPEGGDQPLVTPDESALIVANGEVYNHSQLRQRLGPQVDFSTTSDSETVLQWIHNQGDDAVTDLDGMFSVGVLDREGILLARDPIGIKPLYYGWQHELNERRLYFASEIKALTPFVEEVHEFPPGHYYRTGDDFERYYQLPGPDAQDRPVEELADTLRKRLDAAVKKRLMSDVPLGAFLSGGLDSSITAALAMRHLGELHTFSVGVPGSPDLQAARRVAEHIGSTHHEYKYTAADVRDALPKILVHLESFDRDLVRSAIPTWFCARLAAQHVKVILTGEGADELFAGYTYYKSIQDHNKLQRELQRSVANLHNMNLQRVDRMTMAHGLEGRVPYLDTDFIHSAAAVPPEYKLPRGGNGRVAEKWILRKAFEDLLPDEVVWRDKAQFDEGSGTLSVLDSVIDSLASEFDLEEYTSRHPDAHLRGREEQLYHRLLSERLSHPEQLLPTVARWRP